MADSKSKQLGQVKTFQHVAELIRIMRFITPVNNYNLEILNPADFDPAVADEIVAAINDAINEHDICNIVLAGGKTPAGIYRLLSRPPRSQSVDWSKVRIFWSDERYVPLESHSSNFNLVSETLLSNIKIPEDNIVAFNTTFSSARAVAEDFSLRLKKLFSLSANELPVFDIVLLGVGEDGHTASIFPGDLLAQDSSEIAIAIDNGTEIKDRISLTLATLSQSQRIYFIVRGKNKAEIVKNVLQKDDYPACFFKSSSAKVTWFLDAEAASNLP